MIFSCCIDPVNGFLHVFHEKRIMKHIEGGPEECFGFLKTRNASFCEYGTNGGMYVKAGSQRANNSRVSFPHFPSLFHAHVSSYFFRSVV
jgi:hypothetical protein